MGNILRGIPAMSYGHPSPVCYIGAVMRLMEYLGDPVSEDELFALSGVGLCFPWRFNSCCDEVSIIPEIPMRTFEALGYASEYYSEENRPGGGGDDERVHSAEFYFEQIKRSIDGGRPVIGFGFTELNFTCLITGYDDGGGLYLRAYWPPKGTPGDFDTTEYYYTKNWHGLCRGILVVGAKTGERLTGKAAYDCVVDWAGKLRGKTSVTALGQVIPTNLAAFDAMCEWLLDDNQWQVLDSHEQYLKQCGLLLLNYYRNNLCSYLKKIDAQYPGVVNKPVFAAIERIGRFMPGAQRSELYLNECVHPAITNFSVLRNRLMREKVAQYVRYLKECDNSVQWTLFMPGVVKNHHARKINRESFEYINIGKMRFIGLEFAKHPDIHLSRPLESLPKLMPLFPEYGTEITALCHLEHHHGGEVNAHQCNMMGYFFKAGTPVPDGYDYYDVPTDRAAYAVYYSPNFDGDIFGAAYEFTRDQILGDGVCIPYPAAYWTAEVYPEGFFSGSGPFRFGYLFSVAEWNV